METYTLDDVHLLLQEEGLIAPDEILWGDYDVTTINRRNRNLQITTNNGRDYLVKQLQHKESESARTLKNELLFYKHVAAHMPQLQPLFPHLKYASEENTTLVLDFYKDATPLWRYYKERCPHYFPLKTVAATGRLLAGFHLGFNKAKHKEKLPFLEDELPFVFHLHQPHPRILATYKKGGYRIVEMLQQDEKLIKQWNEGSLLWQINALIHGDIKLDNIIVLPDEGNEESENVKLVDWEMLQHGDLAFDVAGAFQDYIFLWLIMTPDADSAEEMIKKVPYAFSELQPAIQTYWTAYSNTMGLDEEATKDLLHRAVLFAGFRCVQTSFEIANKFEQVPAIAMILFNMGTEIIKETEKAKSLLFGLK